MMNQDATEIMVIAEMSDRQTDCVARANHEMVDIFCELEAKAAIAKVFGVYAVTEFDPRENW